MFKSVCEVLVILAPNCVTEVGCQHGWRKKCIGLILALRVGQLAAHSLGELLLRMRTGALGLCCGLKREEGRPQEAEALFPSKGLESHTLQRKITVTLHPPHRELSHS